MSFANKLKGMKKKFARRFQIDASTARFIAHNRRRWKSAHAARRDGRRAVVLLDMFDWNPALYCHSHIGNYLARKLGARLAAFKFDRGISSRLGIGSRRLEKIYASFGAGLELTYKGESRHAEAGRKWADEVFAGLKSKWDVVNITLEGVDLGGAIYDTYLRTGHYTVDIKDPKLKRFIYDAFIVYRLCQDYFKRNDVKAMLTTHYVYNSHAILVRVACAHGVPVFFVSNPDQFILTDLTPENNYNNLKYHSYKSGFAQIPDALKPAARAEARKILCERLLGGVDRGIADNILEEGRTGLIGYGPKSGQRLMNDTGRPRMLVMLNDFFDAPHWYRWMLFEDYWEWINFLLTKALETPFDWYVKPHPAGLAYNDGLLEILKAKHPKINFLTRASSNRQLVDEGVTCMFTVFGTAGHEFAYMGIPVVTAGDNPHIDYEFNLHPRTVAEYEACIKNADKLKLKLDLDKSKIEEFFYMHYIDQQVRENDFGARCIDEEFDWFKLGAKVNESSMFDGYIRTETAEKDRRLQLFFDQYFAKFFPDKSGERRATPPRGSVAIDEGAR